MLDNIRAGDTDAFVFHFSAWFPGSGVSPSSIVFSSRPPGFVFSAPNTFTVPGGTANDVAVYLTAPAIPGPYTLLCHVSDGSPRQLTLEDVINVVA